MNDNRAMHHNVGYYTPYAKIKVESKNKTPAYGL